MARMHIMSGAGEKLDMPAIRQIVNNAKTKNYRFSAFISGVANSAAFPGTVGRLDAQGRAEAAFVAPPGVLSAHAGERYDWAAVIFEEPGFATEPQGFEILR